MDRYHRTKDLERLLAGEAERLLREAAWKKSKRAGTQQRAAPVPPPDPVADETAQISAELVRRLSARDAYRS